MGRAIARAQNGRRSVVLIDEIDKADLRTKAIEVILELRKLDLSKKPGLSELLDWVGYLAAVKTPVEELDKLPNIGALLKRESDRVRAIQAFPQAQV